MRKFLADTFAMITFSWVIGMLVEIGISGLTLGQSLQARVAGTVVNLLTGGVYGTFRDTLFRLSKTEETSSWQRKTLVGTLAFVLFQVPLYVAVLSMTGATDHQIALAVVSVTIISAVIGGP